jgi:hypothetical protein
MAIANLAVVLIVVACTAYQYFKGTFVKAFAAFITAILAGAVAFAYFELLADVSIGRGSNSRFPALVPWAQPLSLALLFIISFAILQTIVAQLAKKKVDLGKLPEQIGRVVCGILLGLMLSGLLLSALAMAPLPNNYPYQRFDAAKADPQKPKKVLLNADGFATGWFTMLSKGSFSAGKSFAVLHPNFLDQAFLNRHTDDISITTSDQAIDLPRKKPGEQKAIAAWPAPRGLQTMDGQAIPPRSEYKLTIVRVQVKRQAGQFTLSQLRLICKNKDHAKNRLAGAAINVWPEGYYAGPDKLDTPGLNHVIALTSTDFKKGVREIDFAFYVPSGFVPVLLQFKQNTMIDVPAMLNANEAPTPVPFVTKTSGDNR